MLREKRIISADEIERLRKGIYNNGGEGISIDHTRRIVQEYADKQNIARGKVPSYEGGKEVN